MAEKEWPLAFGARGNPSPDDAAETIKQAQAASKKKELKREDELDSVKHERELAEEAAKTAEAKQKREEAASGRGGSPIQVKPIEVDIKAGEKAAEERAKEAREEVKLEREGKERAEGALADERQRRLEDKLTGLTDELKAIREGKGGRTADVVIEEAVKTAEKLGYAKGGTPAVPPEVQVQLKQLDINLQIELEKMRDDRDRRDKEWQLTLKRWDDEKEMRRAELAQKAEAEKDRIALFSNMQERIGRVIGSVVKGGGSVAAEQEMEKTFYIDAGVGEEGETACPNCGAPIFIAPDAKQVMCKCGLTAEIRRKKVEAKAGKGGAS